MIQIETFEGATLDEVRDAINERLAGTHRAVQTASIHIATARVLMSVQTPGASVGVNHFEQVQRWYGWIEISSFRRDLATEHTKGEQHADQGTQRHPPASAPREDPPRDSSSERERIGDAS